MYKKKNIIQENTLQFIHITDTHLLDNSKETFHNINTKKSLESVLDKCHADYTGIDFILVTGDISQTGSQESYTLFQTVLKQLDVAVYCVPGNHDTPRLLQQVEPNCPVDSVNIFQFGKFSLLLLNSCVENNHHGKISQDGLLEIENHLNTRQDQINIIAVHHPPVLINSKWLDALSLQNKSEFLQLLNKHSQNTLVLFGHIHQEIDQQIDNLRLLSTPSTCHQYKANTNYMCILNGHPPAYRYVKLNSSNSIETEIHYVK